MWWKVVIMFSAVVLYGSIGAKVGSNSVSNHPVVSDTCHHALKVQCSVMDMPPGGVECGGELDRIKADMQSKIENISVGVGVFAKTWRSRLGLCHAGTNRWRLAARESPLTRSGGTTLSTTGLRSACHNRQRRI